MRKDLIVPLEEFNQMSKTEQITALCDVYECNPKKRKIHMDQYVWRQWNPHPPQGFLSWWNRNGAQLTEAKTGRTWIGIDAVRAFNCEAVRETYRESKNLPPAA